MLKFLTEALAAFCEPGSMQIEPPEFAVEGGFASCLATLRTRTKHGTPWESRYAFFARIRGGF